MEFDDVDEMPERFEDDLEEFERNQVANDLALEREDDETPLGHAIEESGELLGE
jgi:hypothetical protein